MYHPTVMALAHILVELVANNIVHLLGAWIIAKTTVHLLVGKAALMHVQINVQKDVHLHVQVTVHLHAQRIVIMVQKKYPKIQLK